MQDVADQHLMMKFLGLLRDTMKLMVVLKLPVHSVVGIWDMYSMENI